MELAAFDKIVKDFQYQYMSKIADTGHSASGQLALDLDYEIEFDGLYFRVYLVLNNYWKYLEYGTRPHWPPIDAIKQWIRIKPILPRADKNGKLPTENLLAFLIARKISRVGTPKTLLLQKTMVEFELQKKLANALYEALKNEAHKTYKDEL